VTRVAFDAVFESFLEVLSAFHNRLLALSTFDQRIEQDSSGV